MIEFYIAKETKTVGIKRDGDSGSKKLHYFSTNIVFEIRELITKKPVMVEININEIDYLIDKLQGLKKEAIKALSEVNND